MNLISEKEFYSSYWEEAAMQFHEECFVWGEELYDKKLIIYPKKLKQVENYMEVKGRLELCKIVVVNLRKSNFLSCIPAMFDTGSDNVYLTEANFNSIWKRLKSSVNLGIRLAKERGEQCNIMQAEDIVNLDNLSRDSSIPMIKDDMIQYQSKELTEEERNLHSRRQSLLDNPKMSFYYGADDRYYHDKECSLVKEISAEQFCASEKIPEEKEICPKCRRQVYFRKACAPNSKQIPICDRIFANHRVSASKIEHCVMEAGMKFHATSLDELFVEGKEDKWIIKGLTTDHLSLWHNNYVKVSTTERYITGGYHEQKFSGKTLTQALNYIDQYSWEKHLQSKEKQVASIHGDSKDVNETKVEHSAEHGMTEVGKNDIHAPWYYRIFKWIKKYF